MKIVGVVSMKGGVGKTTVVANLAAALAEALGPQRVVALDLDPQNGLGWHFGGTPDPDYVGVCRAVAHGQSAWRAYTETDTGVDYLPFGWVTEAEREAFERVLVEDPDWLARFAEEGEGHRDVCVIDTPPGDSVYLSVVAKRADLIITVLLSDGGSFATVGNLHEYLEASMEDRQHVPLLQLVNQVDRSDRLNRDVVSALDRAWGDPQTHMVVHRDEAVAEALACQRLVLDYTPHGQPSHDLDRVATSVLQHLDR